jgi:tetratricopeptide (TPR) repeat protein
MTTTSAFAEHCEAARRAYDATLWQEAVPELEAALSLIAAGEAPADDEAALLTQLGACYWNRSEARTAWRTLRRAIALCRERGDNIGMARATMEILRIWGPPDRHRAMAEEALAALGDADPHLRASLLLRRVWFDDDDFEDVVAQVMAIAERHNFEDLLATRKQLESRRAFDEGRIDDGLALVEGVHETYARFGKHDQASGVLRGAGFVTMAFGRLDQGAEISRRTYEYARDVHLLFNEALALTDLAGEAFARAEYDRCLALVALLPNTTDFRGDLYKMWITELRGDVDEAVRLMVDPERAGGAPTALSQTHCANAAVLFHAGNERAAARELNAWADIARQFNSWLDELPPVADCLVALGEQSLIEEVQARFDFVAGRPTAMYYCTLQGRALHPAHGMVSLRLGRIDEAERAYRDGLAWCERERVPVDAGLCHVGLADIARSSGAEEEAREHLRAAASLFERHNATLWLKRLIEPRR